MSDVAKSVETLSPKRRELLDLLLKERGKKAELFPGKPSPDRIPRRTQQSPAPVSFAQQRLWFIDQLDPGTPAFNIPAAIRLLGSLDVAALRRCFDEIISRHETLRTSFASEDGRPVQVIAPFAEFKLPVVDLQEVPEDERLKQVQRMITDDCQRSFDLTRCPLMRATLVLLNQEDRVLILMMHHIIGDVWSVRVVMRELASMYEAFSFGQSPSLSPLPIQYADYAVWQTDWLQGEVLQSQLSYWSRKLSGMPEELRLPTDHPRPPVQSVWGAKHFLKVPRESADAMRAIGREERASLFMTLLAAWKILLLFYTGQNDIVVGAPVANRNRSEFEGMVGFFVNSLILRTDLSGDPPFSELLNRVRETTLGAFSNQDFPFERLVEVLQPERNMSRNPLFQTDFILQNSPRSSYKVKGLNFEALPVENGTAQLDMTLDLWDEADGIGGWLEYDIDLFCATTAARVVSHFAILLGEIAVRPDRRLSEYSLMSAAECHQVLEWNDTSRRYIIETPYVRLFEEQVERTPHAVATACGDDQVTYRGLDRRARTLGQVLTAEAVGPESVVALLAPRNIGFLTAILAVLKTGGAYLPLDPAHPPERYRKIVKQSGTRLVIITPEFSTKLEEALNGIEGEEPPKVLAPADLPDPEDEIRNPPVAGLPDNLAYVIFTSGSTGDPKGVAVHQRGMVNHLWANIEALAMTANDILAQTASQCFDISVWQFLAPLLIGGRVQIFPEEITQDPPLLLREVDQKNVTIFETVPSLLEVALADNTQTEKRSKLTALRWLLPTGEEVSPALCRKWFADFPAIPMMNAYGPSECSDDVTLQPMYASPEERALRMPIGWPVGNLQIGILDEERRQAPIGVPGEIVVRGAGVGRGYVGMPERTGSVFVPDPFSRHPGARMYRTGDLGRYRCDGSIEFLGRMDHQVKIRGFRIELGEIESVLGENPDIRETLVMVREDVPGDPRLVAYLVSSNGYAPAGDDLRQLLRRQLPDYMVPSAFVLLDSMPLSANGKVDRKALPPPEGVSPAATGFVAPRSPIEEVLCAMWSEILGGGGHIGVEDNLFERGAHSLLVTQVLSRVRKTFRVEPPLRTFFESPTIAGMARVIERRQREDEGSTAPPIVPIPRAGRLPLSFTQERMWFLDQLEPGLSAYNVPGAVYMEGSLGPIALESGLSEIVRRHEIFRTTYSSADGKPFQVISAAQPAQLPMVDLQALPEAERESEALRLAKDNAGRPFDLGRGPVLRCLLLGLEEQKQMLAMTTHHIAYDMWAREIFIFELGTFYQSFIQGSPSPLPEPDIQWVDYACWQRQWLQGEVLERQLDYWRENLETAPPYLNLPLDRSRPAVQSYRGARQYLQLPPELSQRVAALSRKLRVTPFITVLAAFKTLLWRYTGQDQIVVGSPIANRNRLEVEKLMGFVANTLVLYTDLSGNPTFTNLLDRVRETTLGAHAHQDIPFESLVQALRPQRDLSRSPIFQVMFNYMLSYSSPKIDLPGLSLRLERLHSGAAQFELNVDLWEADEGLKGVVEYCTDLFDHTTITRLITQFKILLEGVVAAPELCLSECPVLSEAVSHQVLLEWNDSAKTERHEKVYSQLLEAQAKRTPDAVAVAAFGEEQVSYEELNRRANWIARLLVQQGVGPETVVGLLARKGVGLATAILGVMKAGGAYLPLDPAHPGERCGRILQQSGTRLVVTEAEFLPTLDEALRGRGEEKTAKSLVLAELPEPEGAVQNPPVCSAAGNLAYVIHTSGSTGVPKGVLITQRSLVDHNLSVVAQYKLNSGDRVLQFASVGFDVSIEEMLPAWLAGAAVIIEYDSTAMSITDFTELAEKRMLTVLNLPSSFWQTWVRSLSNSASRLPASLRLMIVGSEKVPVDGLATWQSLGENPVEIINAYGLTEATITTTLDRPVDKMSVGSGGALPIGRAVGSGAAYLLDGFLQPAPIGVPGELLIGGHGLARGYLHRPEVTATRFIPDPFSQSEGGRLYRTGDMARHLADGRIELLGRIDYQVKVRGFRVELGEIESALCELPGIKKAVVVAREDAPGDVRLVAYVVSSPGEQPGSGELREHLTRRLPGYMSPSALVFMDAIPLTPAGKVDRRALPPPDEDNRARVATAYVEPQTELEQEIAAVWSELLGVGKIGLHDDFFDLGGHSLLVTQLISHLRDRLHVEVPVKSFFESSTVAGVARVVTALRWAAQVLESADGDAAAVEEGGLIMEEGVL